LEYRWGNGIWDLAQLTFDERIPACVVAHGETAASPGPFLMMGCSNPMRVFGDGETAIAHLGS
jgi:hypothetical protein